MIRDFVFASMTEKQWQCLRDGLVLKPPQQRWFNDLRLPVLLWITILILMGPSDVVSQ